MFYRNLRALDSDHESFVIHTCDDIYLSLLKNLLYLKLSLPISLSAQSFFCFIDNALNSYSNQLQSNQLKTLEGQVDDKCSRSLSVTFPICPYSHSAVLILVLCFLQTDVGNNITQLLLLVANVVVNTQL